MRHSFGFHVARVGGSRVFTVVLCTTSAGRWLLDLELWDIRLVAVRHLGHSLLMVLLVGIGLAHRLAAVHTTILREVIGAVGHPAAFGGVEGANATMITSRKRALLAGHHEILASSNTSGVDSTRDLTRIPRRAQRWLLGHPVSRGAMRRIRCIAFLHGALGR